jgi:hypothetical protein
MAAISDWISASVFSGAVFASAAAAAGVVEGVLFSSVLVVGGGCGWAVLDDLDLDDLGFAKIWTCGFPGG